VARGPGGQGARGSGGQGARGPGDQVAREPMGPGGVVEHILGLQSTLLFRHN